jgi:hemerythrin superfamily protein
MFRAHLQLEEEAIFPAIRSGLPEAARSEMLREMLNRRKRA